MNISDGTKEIVIATVSNPNFFSLNATQESKINQVCELIKRVSNTVKE